MEATGNGARKDWVPPKSNVAFPFKACNFGLLMEIYYTFSRIGHDHVHVACMICLNCQLFQ